VTNIKPTVCGKAIDFNVVTKALYLPFSAPKSNGRPFASKDFRQRKMITNHIYNSPALATVAGSKDSVHSNTTRRTWASVSSQLLSAGDIYFTRHIFDGRQNCRLTQVA